MMRRPEANVGHEHDTDWTRALDDLPLFPLPGVVHFPRALLPLHVFEPRYRAMLAHCLSAHRAMAVVLVPDVRDVSPSGAPRIARVASVAVVLEHQPLPDGRSNILLHGRARVELEETPSDAPWRRARARLLEDEPSVVPAADGAALVSSATAFAAELQGRADFSFALPKGAAIDTVVDLCAQHLVVSPTARQAILEERTVAARVRRVIAELAAQRRAIGGGPGSIVN